MTEQEFSAGGVIVREVDAGLELLLIKDRFGHWTWPKGHVEGEETPEETALREVAEETGLKDVEVIDEIGLQQYYYTLGGKSIYKTVRVYLMRSLKDEDIKVQEEEIDEAVWLSEEAALKKIEYEGSIKMIERGLEMYREKFKV